MGLPIDEMLKDAAEAWKIQVGNFMLMPDDLMGDLARHIRALAAEVGRLEAERDRIVALAQWKDEAGSWRWRLGRASGRSGMSGRTEEAVLAHISRATGGDPP